VSRGTAVQANVGQALAQRRLAEAQRRLRVLADNNDLQGGEEQIASPAPSEEAPADGNDAAVAAPDFATTVSDLDQNEAAGDFGDRQPVLANRRRTAEDTSNMAVARPDDDEEVDSPVSGQTDADAEGSQFSLEGWKNNAQNIGDGTPPPDEDGTSTEVPDGRGSTPMQTGAARKEAMILKKASASQVYQLADLYTELGLVPHEQRYAAIAQSENMPAIVANHTIKVLTRVKEVFAAQVPQGRVARTPGVIPRIGKTAASRTPSMARQAENKRLASSAEDTLLLF
jgi:hypothetical protein